MPTMGIWYVITTAILVARVKKRVSERVLRRAMYIIRSETPGRHLASAKSLAKSLAESLTKILAEAMHGSPQDSLRDSLFYAEV